MKGKTCRILANGQDIDYPGKKNYPRALSAPILELFSIIFKHVYWYIQQISGERLQDHWSSGFFIPTIWTSFILSIILCENIFKKFESTNLYGFDKFTNSDFLQLFKLGDRVVTWFVKF